MPTDIPSVATFSNPEFAHLAAPMPSLTERAAFWLRRDIVRGVFAPKERLKVDPLSKFYGLGRSPIQAAIMQLEPGGLLTHEHQKGHRVAPVSLADYDDVRQLYRELYRIALRKAVEVGDDSWEERVIVVLHRISKIPKVIDTHSEAREMWQLAYKRLHGEIFAGCGSPLLTRLMIDLGNRVERYVSLFGDLESDKKRDHHKEHAALVEVLLRRNAPQLIDAYDEFFQRNQPVRDSVIEKLRKMESPSARRARVATVKQPVRKAAKRRKARR